MPEHKNLYIISYGDENPDVVSTTMPKKDVNDLFYTLKEKIQTQSENDPDYIDGSITDGLIDAIKEKGFDADYEPVVDVLDY